VANEPPVHHLLAAADAADIGLWVWDLAARTAWYSSAFKRRLGYGDAEFEDTFEAFASHVHPEDLPRAHQGIAAHIERRAPLDLEVRMRRRDLTWIALRLRASAEWEGAEARCIRGAAVPAAARPDVPDLAAATSDRLVAELQSQARESGALERARRELERHNQELERARVAAQEAAFSKSAFLANMSHEIRTPMTAILGFADMLAEPGLTDEEQRGVVSSIRRNSEHLLKIINDILDISKIEAGGMTVEPLPCDVASVVEDVAGFLRPRAAACGLDLHVEMRDGAPREIRTDPTRLRQILTNLIGNAIKFTEHGGVHVLVEPVPEGEPLAPRRDPEPSDAPPAARRIRIRVSDTGIGLSAEQIARLFRPFMQADASTTRRFGGTGLGLTISRRLARMLGGDLTVESAPGQGSTFTVEVATDARPHGPGAGARAGANPADTADSLLTAGGAAASADRPSIPAGEPAAIAPASLGAGPQHGAPSADALPAAAGSAAVDATGAVRGAPTRRGDGAGAVPTRILLAEDGEDNQRLISFHLKRGGMAPTVAENGRVACELVEAAARAGQPFDAVLMDMQMPEMDGYHATRRLREMGFRGPILALTAHAMIGDRERCLAAGCDEYLTKPIDRALLVAKIRERLDAPRRG
jgi:signal transduction histidine kinase/ActR/RegA family two-component response regulator